MSSGFPGETYGGGSNSNRKGGGGQGTRLGTTLSWTLKDTSYTLPASVGKAWHRTEAHGPRFH